MFEKATRRKVRWQYRGSWCVEDLWDMALNQLDAIYKGLSRQVKEQNEDSLLDKQSDESETLSLQINIVKHIVETKLAEQDMRENKILKSARKQKLLALIAEKQDKALSDMSKEDLQKLVDDL